MAELRPFYCFEVNKVVEKEDKEEDEEDKELIIINLINKEDGMQY